MKVDFFAYAIPTVTFVVGFVAKYVADELSKRSDHRRKRSDDANKNRREAYLEFLKSIVPLVKAEDGLPDSTVIQQARLKLAQVELDGSTHAVPVAGILLGLLESKSEGDFSTWHQYIPTFRQYLLELSRAELEGRSANLDGIVAELTKDPLISLIIRRSSS